jgi:hypothetical protein
MRTLKSVTSSFIDERMINFISDDSGQPGDVMEQCRLARAWRRDDQAALTIPNGVIKPWRVVTIRNRLS